MLRMKKISGAFVLLAFICFLLPLATSAQTATTTTSNAQSFLGQLQSLQAQIASLQATLSALMASVHLGPVVTSSFDNGEQFTSHALATPLIVPRIRNDHTDLSDDDVSSALTEALIVSATSTSILARIADTESTNELLARTAFSGPHTYEDTVNTSCATRNAQVEVSGGFSCINVCLPVPGTTLICRNGTWQLPTF